MNRAAGIARVIGLRRQAAVKSVAEKPEPEAPGDVGVPDRGEAPGWFDPPAQSDDDRHLPSLVHTASARAPRVPTTSSDMDAAISAMVTDLKSAINEAAANDTLKGSEEDAVIGSLLGELDRLWRATSNESAPDHA